MTAERAEQNLIHPRGNSKKSTGRRGVVWRLRTIVCGGQTGVDQAALRAALACGLEIGGWCPPHRECDDGRIPDAWPLRQTPEERSPRAPSVPRSLRTEWNVRDSDATLVVQPSTLSCGPGTQWTIDCAKRLRRRILLVDPTTPNAADRIRKWLATNAVATLNIAGPSEREAPSIGDGAFALLVRSLRT